MLQFVAPSILKLGLLFLTVRRLRHTVTESAFCDKVKKHDTTSGKRLEDKTNCHENTRNSKVRASSRLFRNHTIPNFPITGGQDKSNTKKHIYAMIFPAMTFTAISSPNLSLTKNQYCRISSECGPTEYNSTAAKPETHPIQTRRRSKRSRATPTNMWKRRIRAVQNLGKALYEQHKSVLTKKNINSCSIKVYELVV